MHTLPVECPFCQSTLTVTELHCFGCNTTFGGEFSLEHVAAFHPDQLPVLKRLARLSPEQLRFVEVFLRCEGKITRVEEELGISYPTVRARLNDVIRTLGFEPAPEPREPRPEAREVLDRLEKGEISPEEAAALLRGERSST